MDTSITSIISIAALLISIASWFIGHSLSKKRDFINKKKELRIQYLINAWQLIENASNRHDNLALKNFEKAIADIQLFGTLQQIQLSRDIAINFSLNKSANCDLLLEELRNDLRNELGLEKVESSKFISLRINKI